MKICTYNIWSADTNFNTRLELLIYELKKHEIDIIALQEVKDELTFNHIKNESKFQFGFYYNGLAFLSRYDIKLENTHSEDNNYILRVSYNNTSFTTVHFDWKNKETRNKGLNQYFTMLDNHILDNEFVLGDFNDVPEEQIHFELTMSDFTDLHQTYCHSLNEIPLPTLDINNNPRWRNLDTDETPSRFDWIMLNTDIEYKIRNAELIGTEEKNGVTPSDHYGVLVNIDIEL